MMKAVNLRKESKGVNPRIGVVKKGSWHHRLVVWSLHHPYFFYGVLGLPFVIAVAAWLWPRATIPPFEVTAPISVPQNQTWSVTKMYPQRQGMQCVEYTKNNGVKMTSCYRYNGQKWVWVTSY